MKHHIVFLTGAGMSQESGLPTFRGENGLWNESSVRELSTVEGLEKSPKKVLDFFNERKKEMIAASPNSAHLRVAKLEERGYRVTVITQNIDNLHERAGSSRVIHLHGSIMYVRNTKTGSEAKYDEGMFNYVPETHEDKTHFDRPDVVLFGEPVSRFDEAAELVSSADLFVIIGTTMTVQPAGSLLLFAPLDCQVVYIDPEPDVDDGINLTVLRDTAVNGVRVLCDKLLPY